MTQALLTLFLLGLGILTAASPAPAETPEEKGLAIAREADRRESGFGDYAASGEMILRNLQGQASRRGFHFKTLEADDGGSKNIIAFDWPPDIKDTALLTHAQKVGEDQQWLYLPSLERVKRITGSGRSGSFAGSEFAYEDLVGQEVEKYTYRWLRDEPCPGLPDLACHVNERFPVDAGSGYRRQIVWLDQDEYRVQRVEYYDRKDALTKVLTADGYKRYIDRFWRPARVLMTNQQTGKTTEMLWSDYTFRTGLREQDFTRRALERAH